MKSLGADRVYIDKMSGKDTERPFLQEMMNFVREGDSVIVESISRFARNTKDLLELTEQLNVSASGISFHLEEFTFLLFIKTYKLEISYCLYLCIA